MSDRPPPSILAVAFASAIVAGLAGYFLGQASSIGVFSGSAQPAGAPATGPRAASEKKAKVADDDSDISDAAGGSDEDDDSDDEDDLDDQELKGFEDSNEECKLVLVVRTDLGMTKGELSMPLYRDAQTCNFLTKTFLFFDSQARLLPSADMPPLHATRRC